MKLENLEVFNFKNAFRGMRNPLNSWERSDSYFGIDSLDYTEGISRVAHAWVNYENYSKKSDIELGTEEYDELYDVYYDWLIDQSKFNPINYINYLIEYICLGPKDIELAQKLIRAGTEHRKFLRQILISFDLTAPLYFWKEFDTYKIGIVSNSTSTMHKLASTPITLECFETDDYNPELVFLSGIDDSGDNMYSYDLEIKDFVETDGLNTYQEPTLIQFLEDLRVKYNKTKDKKYWKELIRWLPESWLQKRTITMNYENVLNIINQRTDHKLSEWNWLIVQFIDRLPYSKELLLRKDINED